MNAPVGKNPLSDKGNKSDIFSANSQLGTFGPSTSKDFILSSSTPTPIFFKSSLRAEYILFNGATFFLYDLPNYVKQNKVHSITCHEGTQGEQRYCYVFLTWTLERMVAILAGMIRYP
jgi:hypothetical protein